MLSTLECYNVVHNILTIACWTGESMESSPFSRHVGSRQQYQCDDFIAAGEQSNKLAAYLYDAAANEEVSKQQRRRHIIMLDAVCEKNTHYAPRHAYIAS